jgi:hypothetical protein
MNMTPEAQARVIASHQQQIERLTTALRLIRGYLNDHRAYTAIREDLEPVIAAGLGES